MENKLNIRQKLQKIQLELVAPKNQYNSFGKYYYRSCEDIQEAIKPLLEKYECTMVISDEIVQVGDRYYIRSEVRLKDIMSDAEVWTTAYARESLDKKGMDDSQITGATSSYARKYALNGLFAIDDTKDADSTNTHDKEVKPVSTEPIRVPVDQKPSFRGSLNTAVCNICNSKMYFKEGVKKDGSKWTALFCESEKDLKFSEQKHTVWNPTPDVF